MRIRREVLFTLAAVIFSISNLYANSENSTRIAIIADKTSGLNNLALFSLLELELSQKEGVELLERAAIDTLLEEQKLSAAGLLDRNTTIKIGKLLRADAFIILSLENPVPESSRVDQGKESGDLFRVRVAETAHGLRLADFFEQSDTINPQQAAERIINKIENTLEKINKPNEKLIPVGIVDIHRVQLGEKYKMLERTLPTMLSVRLSHEPQIIVLEREDLKVLLDEKLMTQGEDTEFWSSAILIDGYIQPNNGQLELHLNLKQAAGENLKSIIIPVEPNEPVTSIEQASTEIINELQNSPPTTKWNPALEAEQYYNKAQMLVAHGRNDEALPLFETAHALQPQNVFYLGTVFTQILYKHQENKSIENLRSRLLETKNIKKIEILTKQLVKTPEYKYTDLELADMVSVLVRKIRDNYEEGKISVSDIYNNFSKQLGTDLLINRGYFVNPISVANEQIKQINRENRKIWIETYSNALKKRPVRNDYPQMNNLARARLAWLSSDIPEELIANLKKAFTEFIMPPELGGKIPFSKERDFIFEQAFFVELRTLSPVSLEETFLKNVKEEFLKLWMEYIFELAEYDDTTVSSKGILAITEGIQFSPDELQRTNSEIFILKAVKDMVYKLINPDDNLDSKTKKQLINNIKKTLLQSRRPIGSMDERLSFWENIYEFLISQNDINSLVELGISPFEMELKINSFVGLGMPTLGMEIRNEPNTSKWCYNFLERITGVLKIREDDRKVNDLLVEIKDVQATILKRFPELDFTNPVLRLPVSMLLTQKDWFKNQIPDSRRPVILPNHITWSDRNFQAKLQNDMLWIAFKGSGPTLGLVGINLKNKKIASLWQSNISFPNSPRLLDLALHNESSYLCVNKGGIIEFPGTSIEGSGKLKNLKVFTENNGLPSLLVTSITIEDNKLWVAYGANAQESGLGIFDPKTERWESVFCSTLKNKSPFSNGQPYIINSMILESQNRLFFNVTNNNFEEKGLWKLNTATLETEHIRLGYASFFKDMDNIIWLNSAGSKSKFNPDSENTTMVIGSSGHNTIKNNSELEMDMFLPESFVNKIQFGPYNVQSNLDLSTGAIHNNNFWARLGRSQIIIAERGKSFEEADIVDNNILNGEPVWRFISTPYGLVGIGNGIVGLIEVGD